MQVLFGALFGLVFAGFFAAKFQNRLSPPQTQTRLTNILDLPNHLTKTNLTPKLDSSNNYLRSL